LKLLIHGESKNKHHFMLGERLRELREAKGLLQRQVASTLDVDTAYVSKMESNDKPVSRHHLKVLARMYGVNENELLPLWLAQKILKGVNKESFAEDALNLAIKEIQNRNK
jgi:transcriptional regulator with XRE-family HTH domain